MRAVLRDDKGSGVRPLGNALLSRQTPSARLHPLVPPVRGVGELFLGQEIFDLAIVGHELEAGPAVIDTLAFGSPKFRIVFCQCVFSGIELADDPIGRRRGPTPMIRKSLIIHISLVGERCIDIESSTYRPNRVVR